MEKHHTFEDIVAHRRNNNGTVDVQIKWNSGELTWEPFPNILKDAPDALAEYGQTREDLLGQAPWDSLNIDSVTGDNMYTFKRIVNHRYKRRCRSDWRKSIDIQIEWDTGEITWEPFENIANDASSELAEYAFEKNLLEEKKWRHLSIHLPEYTSSRHQLKKIRNHRKRNRLSKDNRIELEIEWSNGEITWELAHMINEDAPQMFEEYAKRKNILTDFRQERPDHINVSALEEGSGHTFLVAQRIEFICNYFVEVMKGHELKLPITGRYEKGWIGYDSYRKSDVWLPAIKFSCIKTFSNEVKQANGEKQLQRFLAALQTLQEHASEPSNLKGFETLLIFYGKKLYLSNLWTGEGTKYCEQELWPGKHESYYPSMHFFNYHHLNRDIQSIIKKKDYGNPILVGYERWNQL